MSTHQNDSDPQPRRRQAARRDQTNEDDKDMPPRAPAALATSLESIHIQPRTPRTPRSGRSRYDPGDADGIDEVELSLLEEDERREAGLGMDDEGQPDHPAVKRPISSRDKRAIVLLVVLCE